MLEKHRDIHISFPRHHVVQICQIIFVMLHECKVGLKVIAQIIITNNYAKKLCIPSSTKSSSCPHFEHLNCTVFLNFGMLSKNS